MRAFEMGSLFGCSIEVDRYHIQNMCRLILMVIMEFLGGSSRFRSEVVEWFGPGSRL